jgi:hypothetical protein
MGFYKPIKENRFFRAGKKYSEIDWNDFRVVVAEFQGRIEDWYIQPAVTLGNTSGHFNFAVMALNCLLIDALSQYYYGAQPSPTEAANGCQKPCESSRSKFMDFVKAELPQIAGLLPIPIKTANGEIKKMEDVLYSGFRCGILHEAHVPLFGGITGQANAAEFHPVGDATYQNPAIGTDCPSVTVDPGHLLALVRVAFAKLVSDLLNADAAFDDRRLRFQEKFESSFGIAINTTL